jgi:hypothetical protein
MKRRTVWLCLATLAGCASSSWDIDRFEAPEANIPAQRTFYWQGGEIGTATPIDADAKTAADSAIRQTVTDALVHKGYEQVRDPAGAQLVIGYQISGTRRFQMSDDRRVGAPSPTTVLSPSEVQPPPASTMPREMLIRDGSVMVFANDPATGKLIWRGLVTAELRVGSKEEGVRLINDMVRHIVEGFPARAGAAPSK